MWFKLSWGLVLIVVMGCACLSAEEIQGPAEASQWLAYPDGLSGLADPLRFIIETAQKSLDQRQEPNSQDAWMSQAPTHKRTLARCLGLDPLPPRTPLNARVTGRSDREYYTIENLVYESQPGFFVTANVYIPKSAILPAPAVIVAAGHAMEHGKNHDLYQLGQLSLVKQGMIVLAFDPIGQGERMRPGFAHDLGYGSLLVGQTNEGMIVWDAIRAVDYLETRADVDAGRIGLTGNSGGGELTFYAMPMEARIRVGASFSFVCSYSTWIEKGGNHCICNHLPGLIRELEQFEIIGLNAPRPFLAGNGTEDKIFPIAGVRSTIERASSIYSLGSSEDRIDAVEAPMPHGWSQPLREAGTAWMSHWLLGRDRVEAVPEVGIVAEDPTSIDLRALKSGEMPPGAETVVTLNRKLAVAQKNKYAVVSDTAEAWAQRAPKWRADIWGVLGGRPNDFVPTARTVNTFDWEDLHIEVLSIAVEPGMEVGATLARPIGGATSSDITVFVGGFEQRGGAIRDGRAAIAAKAGSVLVLDPRGSGETARNLNQLVSDGIVTGRPLFAQQVWDLIQVARWAATASGSAPGAVAVHGVGDGALLAIYTAALESPFTRLELEDVLGSYEYFLEDEQPQSILLSVPNILKVADIPQLVALAGPAAIELNGVIGFGKGRLASEDALDAMAYPMELAQICGWENALRVSG